VCVSERDEWVSDDDDTRRGRRVARECECNSLSSTPAQQHTNATACVRLGLAQVSLCQSFACLSEHWPRVVMCCVGARCVRECGHGLAVVMSTTRVKTHTAQFRCCVHFTNCGVREVCHARTALTAHANRPPVVVMRQCVHLCTWFMPRPVLVDTHLSPSHHSAEGE
jgi:hypothetical protein